MIIHQTAHCVLGGRVSNIFIDVIIIIMKRSKIFILGFLLFSIVILFLGFIHYFFFPAPLNRIIDHVFGSILLSSIWSISLFGVYLIVREVKRSTLLKIIVIVAILFLILINIYQVVIINALPTAQMEYNMCKKIKGWYYCPPLN